MNRIFNIVFNTSTGRYVVASEMAKGRKKNAGAASRPGAVMAPGALRLASWTFAAAGLFSTPSLYAQSLTMQNDPCAAAVSSGSRGVITSKDIYGASTAAEMEGFAMGAGASAGTCNPSAYAGAVVPGGWNSIAIGTTASAVGGGIAIGYGATISSNVADGMAFGARAKVTADKSIVMGAGASDNGRAGVFSVGSGADTVSGAMVTRQIINVGAGTANSDAVNVGQLKPLINAIGGGASINASTGVVVGPTYSLPKANQINAQTGSATDVGAAFTKVDDALGAIDTRTTANATNITNLTTRVDQGINISADGGATSQKIALGGTVKYAAGTNTTVSRSGDTISYSIVNNPTFTGTVTANGGLTVGSGQTVNMGGNKITNVANGVATTDAINKGQLDSSVAAAAKWQLQANGGTADTITGTAGATTDVGSALDKVDTALGGLDDDITSLDNRAPCTSGSPHQRCWCDGDGDGADDLQCHRRQHRSSEWRLGGRYRCAEWS